MFKKEPPIGYKFGFFLLRGAKYSKSKGVGMGVADFMKLAPPELIKYFLLRADIDENKDFDPTGQSLMRLYDDYETASEVDLSKTDRAGEKKHAAFRIAGKKRWAAKFLDVLLHYQIYHDWKKVGEVLGDPDGVDYLSSYVAQWIQSGFVPEDYSFSINPTKPESMTGVLEFADKLDDKLDALSIHNLVFEVAKETGIPPAALFGSLYVAIIGKQKGPKLGKLIKALGPNMVKEMLNKFK
jgi:lysyl-tRNA synthetase class 1